jgi:hypothetical protein
VALTDASGVGLMAIGDPLLNVSAWPFEQDDFDFELKPPPPGRRGGGRSQVTMRHTIDLKPRDFITLNLDYGQRGVGGDNSWGAMPHPQYRLEPQAYSYGFWLRPVSGDSGDWPRLARELPGAGVPAVEGVTWDEFIGDALELGGEEAADPFRELEERLLQLPELRMTTRVTSTGAFESALAGTVELRQGNVASIDVEGTFAGPAELSLSSDGARLTGGSGAGEFDLATPEHLNEAIVIGLTRMGILHSLARLTAGEPPDQHRLGHPPPPPPPPGGPAARPYGGRRARLGDRYRREADRDRRHGPSPGDRLQLRDRRGRAALRKRAPVGRPGHRYAEAP